MKCKRDGKQKKSLLWKCMSYICHKLDFYAVFMQKKNKINKRGDCVLPYSGSKRIQFAVLLIFPCFPLPFILPHAQHIPFRLTMLCIVCYFIFLKGSRGTRCGTMKGKKVSEWERVRENKGLKCVCMYNIFISQLILRRVTSLRH